jgi:uncharacterized protein YggU (UPF0235/DUF167 family)
VVAEALGLRGSQVKVHGGETSREKWLLLEGCQEDTISLLLATILGGTGG